jgi:hypothetical protein
LIPEKLTMKLGDGNPLLCYFFHTLIDGSNNFNGIEIGNALPCLAKKLMELTK